MEVGHLGVQIGALVHMFHQNAVGVVIVHHIHAGQNIQVFLHGFGGVFKWLVGAQAHAVAGIHQRVPRNTGALVVSAAEPAVNHQQAPAALDGAFAGFFPHGYMAVHNVAVGR